MRQIILKSLRPLGAPARWEAPAARPPTSDHDLNFEPVSRPARLTAAAVLVPLVERAGGFQVLLTQRTDHLNDHAGQISFPGGRAEATDRCPIDTALRETEEEIGLAREFVDVVGYLDDYETVTGFRVTPVVSFVAEGFTLALDQFEVADAFEVPLQFILDPRNHQTHSAMHRGRRRSYHVFEYRDRYIWGATAGMLMNLYRRLATNL